MDSTRRQASRAKSRNIQGNSSKQFVPLYSFVKSAVRRNKPGLSKENRSRLTPYQSPQRLCLCSTLYLSVRFSHATACTAVSGANSFPALRLPDPLLPASHSTAPKHQSQPNTFPEPSVWLHTFIPPLVQLRKSQNCMLAVGTQRTEPLHACMWSLLSLSTS